MQHFTIVGLADVISSRSASSIHHTLGHKLRVINLHLPPSVREADPLSIHTYLKYIHIYTYVHTYIYIYIYIAVAHDV